MKYFICGLLGIFLMSCLNNAKEKLYVYNWTYYLPQDVIEDFESEYDVQVIYDSFTSNEEMFAKILAGGGKGYDVIFPSNDYVTIMSNESLLEPLDYSKIPNAKYIDLSLINKTESDKDLAFGVPYLITIAAVAVNKKYVKKYEKSWNIFNRKDLKNRMTMLDDMQEVIGSALKSLGFSVNSENPRELEKAKKVIMGWRENLLKFDSDSFSKGFASGEFYVVHGYSENIFVEYDPSLQDEVDFFIPEEGGVVALDSMAILKESSRKELAYAFINFLQRPDINARAADYLYLPTLNKESVNLMKTKPKVSYEDIKRCELKEYMGEKTLIQYNRIWNEVRAGL